MNGLIHELPLTFLLSIIFTPPLIYTTIFSDSILIILYINMQVDTPLCDFYRLVSYIFKNSYIDGIVLRNTEGANAFICFSFVTKSMVLFFSSVELYAIYNWRTFLWDQLEAFKVVWV